MKDLELSTRLIIREAERRGVLVEILDRTENFIRLSRDGRRELVKQATKTSLDNYITFLAMENKAVSKRLLEEEGLPVPSGGQYESPEEALEAYDGFKGRALVVKPNSTNFGIAVSLLPAGPDQREAYAGAVSEAFRHDKTVLAEEFIPGTEYRFLVIGGECTAVLRRIPANVTGDGSSDIRRLVERKNESPLRGRGYVKPLEEIRLGEEERLYLEARGLDFDSVPPEGESVFLRENSNISTGGDSLDETDAMPPDYKEAAVRAAEAAGAAICGVDMIIGDRSLPPKPGNYAVIEINFNPALHIHAYPWKGKNREPEKRVLDLLGFPEN